MAEQRFVFPCPNCRARLRASLQFVCRTCNCPGCGCPVIVPIQTPKEEPSLIVMDDGHRLTSHALVA